MKRSKRKKTQRFSKITSPSFRAPLNLFNLLLNRNASFSRRIPVRGGKNGA